MKTILLIEDNIDIRENTAEILELSNYKVITAENGKIGIEQALEHKPDLIICDIMMPVLDGYGVIHALNKNDGIKNTPFIFLTAMTERSDVRKGMDSGADDYIMKPFSNTELLNAVDSRLKKVELQQNQSNEYHNSSKNLLGADILKKLINESGVKFLKRNQSLYTEGNYPNKLFYIIKGKVKIFKGNDEGKEFITDLLGPGDFLGYAAIMEKAIYKDSAEAIEETELATIPREDFDKLIDENCGVAHQFIELLTKNIYEKENLLLGIAYNSLRKKVANALVLFQKKYRSSNDPTFQISIKREILSNIAGTAKESLIRTLSDFKNEKIIDIIEGKIIILDFKKLEYMVN